MGEEETILLVEDEENDVFFMRRALKVAGFRNPLQVVFDGQEALDYLTGVGEYANRERYPMPCLIFLDLKLPRKNGLDVLAAIREDARLRALLVVMFTSSAEPRDVKKAYALGVRSYIVKPSLPEHYAETLRGVKYYWFELNLSPFHTEASEELQ